LPPSRDEIQRIGKKYWKYLASLPNVNGWSGIPQPKLVRNKPTGQQAFRVYVEKKVSTSILRSDEIIPSELDGIPTDVVELGKIETIQTKTDKWRPCPCGVSENHILGTACTRGWYVRDNETGELWILGCNHCYARSNQASIGDKIIQPSPLDGGTEADQTGELVKFITIDFEGGENKVDIAFVRPLKLEDVDLTIFTGIDFFSVVGKADAELNQILKKSGRTTCLTKGKVVDTALNVNVYYGDVDKTAYYVDQIYIESTEKIVSGGDSGSLFVTEDNQAVGLLFAGTADGLKAVANKISNIELIGNVTLITVTPAPTLPYAYFWSLTFAVGIYLIIRH